MKGGGGGGAKQLHPRGRPEADNNPTHEEESEKRHFVDLANRFQREDTLYGREVFIFLNSCVSERESIIVDDIGGLLRPAYSAPHARICRAACLPQQSLCDAI